jgi:hypothetical protein
MSDDECSFQLDELSFSDLERAVASDPGILPSAPPIPEPTFRVEYTGETIGTADQIPLSGDDVFKKILARDPVVSVNPMRQVSTIFSIVQQCEQLVQHSHFYSASAADIIEDCTSLLAHFDNFAMEHRPAVARTEGDKDAEDDGIEDGDEDMVDFTMDRAHQIALFVVRMKLLYVLSVFQPGSTNASERYRDTEVLHEQSALIDDASLVAWLADTRASHPAMIEGGQFRVRTCTLECLWRSLLAFMHAWPRLQMCATAVRYFNELRERVAFFLSYREETSEYVAVDDEDADLTLEQLREKKNDKILGLAADMFVVLGFNEEKPTDALIDSVEMSTITRDANNVAYSHVNKDFVDETERILHAIQVQLRRQLGFELAPCTDSCIICSACTVTASDEAALTEFVGSYLCKEYQSILQDELRKSVFDLYIEPGELEHFIEYHPSETHDCVACIAKMRAADYKVLCRRYLETELNHVWVADGLSKQPLEPAHALISAIVCNFALRQMCKGAQFDPCFMSLADFSEFDYRCKRQKRFLEYEAYTDDEARTFGSLRYRFSLMHMQGVGKDRAEMLYQHPLVVRTIASYAVLYNRRLHRCGSFSRAFLLWLVVMCLDEKIGGLMTNGARLFPLAKKLLPRLSDELDKAEARTTASLQKWAPLARMAQFSQKPLNATEGVTYF